VLILRQCNNALWEQGSRVGRAAGRYISSKCRNEHGWYSSALRRQAAFIFLAFVHQVSSEKRLIATTGIAFVYFRSKYQQQAFTVYS